MITNRHIALAILAALTMTVPGLGNPRHPVERSVKGYAIAHWEISLADGSCTTTQVGITTHLGACTLEGTGLFDFGIGFPISASGTGTVPNGDQVFWEAPPPAMQVIFTGGTGRFQGITGVIDITEIVSGPFYDVDEAAGIMTMDVVYTCAGTVTY